MITREEALNFLQEKIVNKNIIKHMYATEALMRTLALHFRTQKEDEWAMAGLLHDGDYSEQVPVEKQGTQITIWLREKGYEIPDNVAQAMASHNWHNNGIEPKIMMDWALFCGDTLTGLIVATALVMPDKKLSSVTLESVLKKFKDPSFARGTRREDIKMCEQKLGIPLGEFVRIGLESMQKISYDLSL